MTIVIGATINTPELSQVRMEAWDIGVPCQAIAIRVSGTLLVDSDDTPTWLLCKTLEATGHGDREFKCVITSDDPPSTIDEYYAAKLNAKLGTVSRAMLDDVGESADLLARSRARQIVQSAMDQAIMRRVTISGELPDTLPERGDTVTIMYNVSALARSTYSGVVYDMMYTCSGNAETLEMTLIDYNSTELQ